jgi:metallophosphoesterase (TIGR00282 family)
MPHDDVFGRFINQVIEPSPQFIRILMVGDVVGRPGRKVLKEVLDRFRATVYPDLVTMNAENVAGGFGITTRIHDDLLLAGVDVLTMGNHWKDKADIHALRKSSAAIVLPHNLPDVEGVTAIREFAIRRTSRVARVVNLMGLFAMKETYGNPFFFLNDVHPMLASEREAGRSIVLVDFHGEASSEKQAVAWQLNGVCAALIGTHTHTPTSDERITSRGTAFLTDVGMTGPYGSVIGMDIERTLPRYFAKDQKKRAHEVADVDPWFCGFFIEIDPRTGLSERAHRMQYRSAEARWIISTVQRSPAAAGSSV